MTKNILLLITLFCCLSNVFSQEESIEYGTRPNARLKSSSKIHCNSELVSLPFFDDFAYPQNTPQKTLWKDSDVYVNKSFGKDSPTIGTATFDALNEKGLLYSNASSNQFIADFLTSQPINTQTYRTYFPSDELYILDGSDYVQLDDKYYLFDKISNSYKKVTTGLAYAAGDTIYTLSGSSYSPFTNSFYTKNGENYTYIKGSLDYNPEFLNYDLSDSLALSFYFQAGGYGDTPESTDSLVLEFYTPSNRTGIFINEISNDWIEIYNATDTIVSLENYILIPNFLDSLLLEETLNNYLLSNIKIYPYNHAIIKATDLGEIEEFTESLAFLFAPDTTVIDSIATRKEIIENISYARIPDGAESFSITAILSPEECNPNWEHIWSNSNNNSDFNSIYIPLINSKYLCKGFRFRFKNYASLSNDNSHARNEDFWNIDMVWLNSNRTKNRINPPDVAFTQQLAPLYRGFSSVPIKHFSEIKEYDFRMSIESAFSNFDEVARSIAFNFAVDKVHANENIEFPIYNTNLDPYESALENDALTDFNVDFYDFIAADALVQDYGEYEFQYYFSDNNNSLLSQYRHNDTNRVSLTLDNYYSYDDGTPEAGYGLREAPMSKVAYKYKTLKPDTLKAIDIYFNPTLNDSDPIFNLCVWDADESGYPGELLYYQAGEKVDFGNNIYDFVTYKIKEEGILTNDESGIYIDGTFFVGWQQPYDVLINVGIDLQSSAQRKLFFNLGYEWTESVTKGALLIHPVFGKLRGGQTDIESMNSDVKIYPTIAKSTIYIESKIDISSYKITSSVGATLEKGNSNSVNINNLTNGIYFISITLSNGKTITKKFLKQN